MYIGTKESGHVSEVVLAVRLVHYCYHLFAPETICSRYHVLAGLNFTKVQDLVRARITYIPLHDYDRQTVH